MVGLPGDTLEKDIFSAKETVKIAPQLARLYPTVVLRDTALYDAYRSGTYTPLAEAEAVERTKAMYEILDSAGINIIRVGLKSSDIMAGETAFHPAFRQLVEGSIARDRLEMQLAALPQPCRAVVFSQGPTIISSDTAPATARISQRNIRTLRSAMPAMIRFRTEFIG